MATTTKRAPKKATKQASGTKARPSRKKAKPAAADIKAEPPQKDPRDQTGPCPQSERHTHTRVFKDVGHLLKCVCDDCGNTWERPKAAN